MPTLQSDLLENLYNLTFLVVWIGYDVMLLNDVRSIADVLRFRLLQQERA